MRRRLVTVVLVAGACASGRLLDRMPYGLARPVAEATTVSPEVGLHDAVVRRIALPPLAHGALPPGYRELRVSTGHGMILGAEYPMLRVVESGGRVSGELLMYRADLRARGTETRWLVRRALRELPEEKWRTIVARLDSLEVGRPAAIESRPAWMDAGELVVEVRDGDRYMAYQVNAPRRRSGAEAGRAAALESLVDSLARLVQ